MLNMTRTLRYLTGLLDQAGRKKFRILILLNAISPIADIFNFSAIIYIVRMAAGQKQASPGLYAFLFLMIALSILKGLFEAYKAKLSNQFVYFEGHKLSLKLYELLLKEDLQRHNEKTPMQALAAVRGDTASCVGLMAVCVRAWVALVTLAGYAAVLIVSLKWTGAACCAALLLLMGALFLLNRARMKWYGERIRAWEIKVNSQVTGAYGAFKEIKASGRFQPLLRRYESAGKTAAQLQSGYRFRNDATGAAAQSLVTAASFAVLALFLNSGGLSAVLAPLTVYILAMGQMLPMSRRILDALNAAELAQKNFIELQRNFDSYEALKREEAAQKGLRQIKPALRQRLLIQGLCFAYDGREALFEDLSLEIPAGCSVAIIGGSGTGKTTLLNLILGLLKPQAGAIYYDGYDVVAGADAQGRCAGNVGEIVSHIPQTVYLNGETVRTNVAFFADEEQIDDRRVVECLKCAQVWEEVSQLPEGIYTVIGENGAVISGGQRQRIALARALYKDFELLILDEATASLDGETERAVMDAIRQVKGERTILLATHHTAVAGRCDRVYKIENRRLVRVR